MLIAFGGPLFNFIFAFIVLFAMFGFYGKPMSANDLTSDNKVIVSSIEKNSIAANSGIKIGDEIISVNEANVSNPQELIDILQKNINSRVRINLKRDKIDLIENIDAQLSETGKLGIGIGQMIQFQKIGFVRSGIESAKYIIHLIQMTIHHVIKLFTTKDAIKDLSGAIQIAKVSGAAIASGFMNFLFLLVLISVNLAVFNLIPIPALDGGRILFYFLDMIWIGKFIGERMRALFIGISFIFLIGLMIFANLNDVMRFLQ